MPIPRISTRNKVSRLEGIVITNSKLAITVHLQSHMDVIIPPASEIMSETKQKILSISLCIYISPSFNVSTRSQVEHWCVSFGLFTWTKFHNDVAKNSTLQKTLKIFQFQIQHVGRKAKILASKLCSLGMAMFGVGGNRRLIKCTEHISLVNWHEA